MNFRLNPTHSVILMSQRKNAPYNDSILDDNLTIIYEGHDAPKTEGLKNPKSLDQPAFTKTGKPTENGKFVAAVEKYRKGGTPEPVRVYEKLLSGVWSYRGTFDLIDYDFISDGQRKVYRFALKLTDRQVTSGEPASLVEPLERTRIIPTEVKKLVWKRDKGRCVICGSTENLHFDHDIPFSRGGSSITVDNVRILCAKHNLQKHDKIE